MNKYSIIFDDGNMPLLVATELSFDEATEIIRRQLEPSCYKMIKEEQAAG